MNARARIAGHAPRYVTMWNSLAKLLLNAGVPLGPNGLLTVRGRKTGTQRTTPVAIIVVSGRRWIWAPWGEVQWVRNLRAAGHATITVHGHAEDVMATELGRSQRVEFFRDHYALLVRGVPLGAWFVRVVDGIDIDRPTEAAEGRPVFELLRSPPRQGS